MRSGSDRLARPHSSTWRAGIDTGGTFADLVARPPGASFVRTAKLPRDAGAERLADALIGLGIEGSALIVHGTTHVTNAVLEATFARTALVTTRGFADVLHIGRQARDDLYDLARPARVAPVVPADLTFELDERCRPDGTVERPLRDDELERLVTWISEQRVEALAVCLLHAYANPAHERRVGDAVGDRVVVSLSHRVNAEAREYERAAATALNAAVQAGTRSYVGGLSEAIRRRLPDARLFVVHSGGGMLPTDAVADLPLATVMSGPAAGVSAVSRLARRGGVRKAVSFDMGGTSTDVALLLDGSPALARERRVGGHVIRVPAVAVESIAVGGGSIVALDDVGALTVGPRSAGATPGPAAYGRGGTEPTITDAAMVCGLIGAGGDAPGLTLHRELAVQALGTVAARMGITEDDLAWRAVDIAQSLMGRALRSVVTRRGHDLRTCTLVAYGGGGSVHAGPLAARSGIPRVLVPALAPVLSALGCCMSDAAIEGVRTHRCLLAPEAMGELERVAGDLVADETARLGEYGTGELQVTRRLELRYLAQNAELPITWAPGETASALATAFAAAHRREYGFATDDPVEVTAVTCRVEAPGTQTWPASGDLPYAAPDTASLLLPGGERRSVPVVAVGDLAGGATVQGPALLAAPFGSVTVWPRQVASGDEDGTVVLEAA